MDLMYIREHETGLSGTDLVSHMEYMSETIEFVYGYKVDSIESAAQVSKELHSFLSKKNSLVAEGVQSQLDRKLREEIFELLTRIENFIRTTEALQEAVADCKASVEAYNIVIGF